MAQAPILVLDATGTVGTELVKQLLQAGQDVRVSHLTEWRTVWWRPGVWKSRPAAVETASRSAGRRLTSLIGIDRRIPGIVIVRPLLAAVGSDVDGGKGLAVQSVGEYGVVAAALAVGAGDTAAEISVNHPFVRSSIRPVVAISHRDSEAPTAVRSS